MSVFSPIQSVTPRAPVPPGFRPSVESGLVLPEPLSRERQVWTKDEWRLLERATAMLHRHGVTLFMRCDADTCQEAPLEPMRLADGSFQLRCAHMDRVMTKAF